MKNIKNVIEYIINFAIIYMCIDILGLCWWVASGQPIPDTFYIGQITANILSIIM